MRTSLWRHGDLQLRAELKVGLQQIRRHRNFKPHTINRMDLMS